eukprot:3218546-Amphidinium_carterae.1
MDGCCLSWVVFTVDKGLVDVVADVDVGDMAVVVQVSVVEELVEKFTSMPTKLVEDTDEVAVTKDWCWSLAC